MEFYAANKDYPEETSSDNKYSRKLKADLFIDDRNLGGLPDWGVIYRMVHDGLTYEEAMNGMFERERPKQKKNIFLRIGEALEGGKR